MIYIIRGCEDGLNFGYVRTRAVAEKICATLPTVFTWEALADLETNDAPKGNEKLRTSGNDIRCDMRRFGASPDS